MVESSIQFESRIINKYAKYSGWRSNKHQVGYKLGNNRQDSGWFNNK